MSNHAVFPDGDPVNDGRRLFKMGDGQDEVDRLTGRAPYPENQLPDHLARDCPRCSGSGFYKTPLGCQGDECEDEDNCHCECHQLAVAMPVGYALATEPWPPGMTPNPDPLHAPEPDPPRRSGCLSVLPWLALILVWVLW